MRVFCLSCSWSNPSMWAYYASGQKGFCVEYDTRDSFDAPSRGFSSEKMDLLLNTRPVVYRLERPDCTDLVADLLFGLPNEERLDSLYLKSLYVKGLNWYLEQEWRFVLPEGFAGLDEYDNYQFFPVKAVYAGALMEESKLESLRQLCSVINVPLVKLEPDSQRFTYRLRKIL